MSRRSEFDAFAGGYPVPPKGDQVLPELAGVLSASDRRGPGRRRPDEHARQPRREWA